MSLAKYAPLLAALLVTTVPARAQEPVVAAADPEGQFTDPDPRLHANKQVVLHVLRELIQCNYWEQADKWMSERYIQHHPAVPSGRDNIIAFFKDGKRAESCERLTLPIVTVLTSDDIVGIVFRMEYDHPSKPGQKYTTIWYDQWRVVDGKVDEHWDTSQLTAAQ